MNKIDIDRLHKVHLGDLSGRRCGRTTWFATTLIGTSQLPDFKDKTIAVACTTMQRANHIIRVVWETCKMMDIKYKRVGLDAVQINETTFQFTRYDSNTIRGREYIDGE